VAGLSGGIYTPTTVKVRCRSGRRADLELSAEDVRILVSDDGFLDWVGRDMPERLEELTSAAADLDR
jgi:hypothetical protein